MMLAAHIMSPGRTALVHHTALNSQTVMLYDIYDQISLKYSANLRIFELEFSLGRLGF